MSILSKLAPLGGSAGALVLAVAAAGCAVQSSSFMGIGSGRSAMSDPKKSVFAPAPAAPAPAYDPYSPVLVQPKQASARPGAVVQVQDGDTITDIASRHKVSISAIMSENRLKDPNIFPGMQLRIPAR